MRTALFLFVTILLTTLACNKEDELYYFQYKVDDVVTRLENYELYGDNLQADILTITLRDENTDLYMIVNPYNGEGTYTDVFVNYSAASGVGYLGEMTLIITAAEEDEHIIGTFSGDAKVPAGTATVQITEGEFRMKI